MPTVLSETLTQMRAIWARLDAAQRLTVGSVLALTLVGLGALVVFAGRPDWVVALRTDDAAELTQGAQALSRAGIGFREDGEGLLVDADELTTARATLRRDGIGFTGSDDGAVDDLGVLGNLAVDSLTRKDALWARQQARASAAVRELGGVVSARVTASKPKHTWYRDPENDPKAAATVVLRLRRGESFRAVARAAVSAAASSLGIPEANVTAIDAETKERFALDEAFGAGLDPNGFLEQQRRRGTELTTRAQQLLDRAYAGRVSVTVTAELDPTWERTSERIQPESPALTSDETTRDEGGGRRSLGDPSIVDSGANGTAGDTPGGRRPPSVASRSQETRRRQYEAFSGTRDSGLLAPDLRRLTVALVVDKSLETEVQTIEDVVKRAVGFVGEGQRRTGGLEDSIKTLVAELPPTAATDGVDDPAVAGSAGGLDVWALVREHGPLAAELLAVALVLLFLRGLLRRAPLPARGPVGAGGGGAPRLDPDGQEIGVDERLDELAAAAHANAALSPEEQARRMRRDIEKKIADDPAAISRLLEGWLSEQKVSSS